MTPQSNNLKGERLIKEQWFLLGDIHGQFLPVKYFYEKNKNRLSLDKTKNYLILLGDVGTNYYGDSRDKALKEKLSQYPFTYICLRGNHEARVSDVVSKHPQDWELIEKYGALIYIEKKFPNIHYLLDSPAIYVFNGYKTLSIPGAYSVDKFYRLSKGYAWFENEQLSSSEKEKGQTLIKNQTFDLVISHTCPLKYEPIDLFLPQINQALVDKSMECYLDSIENQISYKCWAWGHYHADRLYPYHDNNTYQLMLSSQHPVALKKFLNISPTTSLSKLYA